MQRSNWQNGDFVRLDTECAGIPKGAKVKVYHPDGEPHRDGQLRVLYKGEPYWIAESAAVDPDEYVHAQDTREKVAPIRQAIEIAKAATDQARARGDSWADAVKKELNAAGFRILDPADYRGARDTGFVVVVEISELPIAMYCDDMGVWTTADLSEPLENE